MMPLREALEHMNAHRAKRGCAPVLLMMGRMLKGCVDEDDRRVFGKEQSNEEVFDAARDLVRVYQDCIRRARDAVMTWMTIAKQMGLYRDISLLVGQMVWEKRDAYL